MGSGSGIVHGCFKSSKVLLDKELSPKVKFTLIAIFAGSFDVNSKMRIYEFKSSTFEMLTYMSLTYFNRNDMVISSDNSSC
ncbi:hypothetical protein LINGRAPRIM_LOCUS1386 [Linum grandiflorum]